MKGLVIAYSFLPNQSVGSLRPSYWVEEGNQQDDVKIDVITATNSDSKTEAFKRIYIENKSTSFWSFLIKDEGLTWRKDLLIYLKTIRVEEYDFVLFTGGPFIQFSLGKFFKKKGVKVIFDYRDPYSNNPRFNDNFLRKGIKQWIENRFIKSADLVVTVNEACHKLIARWSGVKREIIPNGYDERVISNKPETEQSYDLFYAGRFYWEPKAFFGVVRSMNLSMGHAGNPQEFNSNNIEREKFTQLGLMKQSEMYRELNKAEIGVLFTMNVPFESTTKLYDYLAFNKKILVITQGDPHTGVLKRELEDYPNYRWVRNNVEDIQRGIEELKASRVKPFDSSKFSRKKGLEILTQNIRSIVK